MMRDMTSHRPWFDSYPSDAALARAVPQRIRVHVAAQRGCRVPGQAGARVLRGSHDVRGAARRGRAVLGGARGARGPEGRSGRHDLAELPRVRDRVLRLPAPRGRRRGQQPAVHRARARAPDQRLGREGDDRARSDLPSVRADPRRRRRAGRDRGEAEPVHEAPDQVAGAAEVQVGCSQARHPCPSSRPITGCGGGPT